MNTANNNTKPFYKTAIPKDWEEKRLGDVCSTFKSGLGITSSHIAKEGNYPVYGGNGLRGYTTNYTHEGSYFLIGRQGALCGNIVRINGKSYISEHAIAVETNSENDNSFLAYKLDYINLNRLSESSAQPGLSVKKLVRLKLVLPPLPEQRAIAQLLSTWDTAINKSNQLIAQKQLHKKWLMQNLLTGRRRSDSFIKSKQRHETKLGELPIDWDIMFLKDLLSPAGKSLNPEKDKLYQQIGIRSHTKGIFYKEKVTGATLGNKRVFWIEPNCFVVNIVFAWEHAIAKTTDNEIGMIASHRFPMYKPKDGILDLDYLLYYFKSPRGKQLLGLASPGGAGRNKTLGKSEFMKLKIPVPSIKEQTSIAEVLQTADKEIKLLTQKRDHLKEQKKGMMQVLLTGRKRLRQDC